MSGLGLATLVQGATTPLPEPVTRSTTPTPIPTMLLPGPVHGVHDLVHGSVHGTAAPGQNFASTGHQLITPCTDTTTPVLEPSSTSDTEPTTSDPVPTTTHDPITTTTAGASTGQENEAFEEHENTGEKLVDEKLNFHLGTVQSVVIYVA